MDKTTRNSIAGIALLLIGLSLATAVNLTAPRVVRANPGVLYAAPVAQGSGNCSSWANACTLQTALANAVSGDEIWVKAGVHKPTTNSSDRNATFTLRNGVALYGGFAGTETQRAQRNWQTNVTVLSGDIDNNDITDSNGVVTNTDNIRGANSKSVVTGSGTNSTAALDGFVITAGQADYSGGGMYNYNGSPTLSNLTFSGNIAGISSTYGGSGGGMYNSQGNPTLIGVTFTSNTARGAGSYGGSGGGMYNSQGNPMLIGVTFTSNTARGGSTSGGGSAYGGSGGGMYNYQGSPTLVNVTFSGNRAEGGSASGGGFAFGGKGGGMYNSLNDYQGGPTLTNVTFADNRAWGGNQGGGQGGGMYNRGGNPTLTNAVFYKNLIGLFDGNGIYNYESSPILTNVTLVRSVSLSSLGSIIHNDFASNPTLVNVIAWVEGTQSGEKTVSNSNNASPRIAYSNIEGCGGSGGAWNSACGIDAGNNIEANPLFVDAANGNLRLQSGSPAINSGDDNAIPAGVTTDRDGNPRFSGLTVDMGAYEFQSTTAYRLLVRMSGNGSGQVTSTPAGILCPGDCSHVYAPNTVVALTAASGASSTFVGWSGDLISNVNPLPLTVMSHTVITATFIQHNAPYFTSTPVPQAVPGLRYSYAVTATDPDLAYGDILTISAPTLPAWLTLVDNGDGTATLFGTPDSSDVGQHTVVLRVTDQSGLHSEQTFTIRVSIRVYLPLVIRNTP